MNKISFFGKFSIPLMELKYITKLFLLLPLIFILHLNTPAEIRYVSKTGSSTPPYLSWSTAADSIQECINICQFGDTIYVGNGVYKERINFITGIAIIGSGMDSCIIDTRGFQYYSGFYSVKMADSSLISGFNIITYDENHGFGILVSELPGMPVNANIIFNKISDATNGIRFTSYSLTNSRTNVLRNIINNVNTGSTIILNNPLFINNIIYPRETGFYTQLNSSPSFNNNFVVFRNAYNFCTGFYDSGNLSVLKNNLFIILDNRGGDYGIYTFSDTVINNIVIGNFDYGVFTSGSVVKNNHFAKTLTALRYYSNTGGPPPIFQYNNLWQNQTNYQNFTADSTNIYTDPMFADADSLDFHLQKYSHLIDAGDPSILDVDGSRSDIGIFGGPFGEAYVYRDLPPRMPVNFTAVIDTNLQITLKWNKNTESDFSYYRLYRDTTAQFIIDSTKLISEQTDSFYIDTHYPGAERLYYKVTAVDSQGNQSVPSYEHSVIISSVPGEPIILSDYILYQNYPNPYNPSTTIGYQLKERGYVKLYVYDIKGELVQTLVNQTQEGGYYEVVFSAKNTEAADLASGIYIYQIMIRNENRIPVYSDIKKMIYLK